MLYIEGTYIRNIDQAKMILPRVEDEGNMVLAKSIFCMYPKRSPVNIIFITYIHFFTNDIQLWYKAWFLLHLFAGPSDYRLFRQVRNCDVNCYRAYTLTPTQYCVNA